MEINKRDRSALKAYFVEYALPTEDNFAELIDGMINQKDDGIVKQPGSPLSLQASGDASSTQKVLNLYEDFAEANPAWTLSLRPRVDPGDPATGRKGLSISTSGGVSRLFIDHATGRVGIGTVDPQATLHVMGNIICSGTVTPREIEGADWIPLALTDQYEKRTVNHITNATTRARFGALSDPASLKDSNGIVHLRGSLRVVGGPQRPVNISATSKEYIIAQLPEGYAPTHSLMLPVCDDVALGSLAVLKDGRIIAHAGLRAAGFSLDGISYPAKGNEPSPVVP